MPVNDQGDAYKLLYPFGWQEVSVTGQDVVYKDIIEPLESVSVNMVPTDKEDITLFGTPEEVTAAPSPHSNGIWHILALTPPSASWRSGVRQITQL